MNRFHQLPKVYNYLDVGHHGWLGWPNNFNAAVPFFLQVAQGTAAGVSSVDGFITNTANYGPTKEPFLTAGETFDGGEVYSSTFYQYDPNIDEEDYAAAFDQALIAAGFPPTLGFLIDTSRNGWGGPQRPTGPANSASSLDAFVDGSKIDERDDMGQWCNQENSGLGVPPTVNPGYFGNLLAYVWIKPPGESDGNYPGSVYNGVTSTTGDPNCDPAHSNALANGMLTDAIPDSPPAGTFFPAEFSALVTNAFPAVPASTATASFSITPPGAVSLEQGTTVTGSLTVSVTGGFDSPVALTVSGLPAGVTASINPATVTGAGGSTLAFTASSAATLGAATVTILGASGTTTASATFTLTVAAAPNFSISALPRAISIAAGATGTSTVTIGYIGGLTGMVSLSASFVPGVSINFSPSSVNASGTVSVSFFVQSGTAAGTSTVTITGADGAIKNKTHITLTIRAAAPSFTLAPSARSLSVTRGTSGADTIAVTQEDGFTGSVTLAVSGLPSGVTAAFATNPTTGSSALTFTAGSTAATGTATIIMTGTSGLLTASATIALAVTAPVTSGFACHIGYTVTNQWAGGFGAALTIDNTGTVAISSWTLTWTWANGQTITQLWNGNYTQAGASVSVTNAAYNGTIAAGGSYTGMGFNGAWNNVTNAAPTSFAVNGTTCN